MLIERIFFNLIAFLLFIFIFYKMVKKNDSNFIFLLVVQALGIAISFIELLFGQTQWSLLKFLSYIMSIALPLLYFYLEKRNINLIEKIYMIKINICKMLKNDIKIKKILIDLLTKYPESYYGHKSLAEIYEKEGGMRKAIDEYVKAIDIKKTDYDSYYKIAELLNNLTRKDEAITMLENLLRIKPDYLKASSLLGEILLEDERYKEAASVFLDAIKYEKENYDLYYNLGIAYTHLNDFKNAKIVYEKAAEISHFECKASFNLGKIALIYNDLDNAESYFTKAIYGEEVEAMSYYELAKVYMFKKDKEKAIIFLQKSIDLEEIYAEKYENDIIFNPIRAYIRTKPEREDRIIKKLSENEIRAIKHLNETSSLVENLNDIDKKKITIDFNKEFNDR